MTGTPHFRAPMSSRLKVFTAVFLALMAVVLVKVPSPASYWPIGFSTGNRL